jgi:hypothetical protein
VMQIVEAGVLAGQLLDFYLYCTWGAAFGS